MTAVAMMQAHLIAVGMYTSLGGQKGKFKPEYGTLDCLQSPAQSQHRGRI
jgi:hypothetical protein